MKREYNISQGGGNVQILQGIRTDGNCWINTNIYMDAIPNYITAYKADGVVMEGANFVFYIDKWAGLAIQRDNAIRNILYFREGSYWRFEKIVSEASHTAAIKRVTQDTNFSYVLNSTSISNEQFWNTKLLSSSTYEGRIIQGELSILGTGIEYDLLYNLGNGSEFYGLAFYKDSSFTEKLYEFLPARMGTRYGVYETITQTFFGNCGTGVLTGI